MKVLALFRTETKTQIFGGKVTAGKVHAHAMLRVLRDNVQVAEGKLMQLQSQKSAANEVVTGQECGMKYEGPPVVQIDDVVVAFTREVKVRHIGG